MLDLYVKICDHSSQELSPTGQVHFDGPVTVLREPKYHGVIDIEHSTARFCTQADRPLAGLEYFLRVTYAQLAYQRGGFLCHGAGIIHRQKGYLFFGHSGAGKTTVSRLSQQDQVLNDDLVILLPPGAPPPEDDQAAAGMDPDQWSIHATPFWNPTQVKPSRLSHSLAAGFRLVQNTSVHLQPLTKGQALARLLACVPILSMNTAEEQGLLDRIENLQSKIPIFDLHFQKEPSFWQTIDGILC